MMKIAVIPSLEPDHKLLVLLEELKQNNYHIIVINDGSSKDYDNIFLEAKKYAEVITHNQNRGKGAALKTAFTFIENNFKDYLVITLDSDGQHKVRDANKLIAYLDQNKDYLVLGKRPRGKKTPLRSKIGNSLTRFIFSKVTSLDIYDTQTGLRAFSHTLMPYMLNLPGEGFEYEMNMLMYASLNNIKIKELEIETIYFNNNKKSHFNTFKDSFKIYKEIFKFASSSFPKKKNLKRKK